MRSYFSTWFPVVFLTALTTSCGIFPSRAPHKAKPVMYEWSDDGGPGEVSVAIDLTDQIATYKRGTRVIGWSFVSTGKEGHATATGSYKILEKLPLKVSDRYGWIADEAGNVTNGDATPRLQSRLAITTQVLPCTIGCGSRLTASGCTREKSPALARRRPTAASGYLGILCRSSIKSPRSALR